MTDRLCRISRRLLPVVALLLCVRTAFAQDPPSATAVSRAQDGAVTPLVIAHRGASGYLPEHTTESAVLAHALGADFIEQDVVLSRDGRAVVLHDVVLDHVSDVAERWPHRVHDDGHYYVADFTLDELRQLRMTERTAAKRRIPGTRFPAGQGTFRIATLEEHLALIGGLNESRRRSVGVYVEIKRPGWHRSRGLDPVPVVQRILNEFGYRDAGDAVFVQCFEFDALHRLRTELGCELPLVQLLSDVPTADELDRYAAVVDGLGVSLSCLVRESDAAGQPETTDLVSRCHERALVVHAWTFRTDQLPDWCESPDQLLDVLVRDCGVDGIFCDQPDVALAWRTRHGDGGPVPGPFRLLNERPRRPSRPSGR